MPGDQQSSAKKTNMSMVRALNIYHAVKHNYMQAYHSTSETAPTSPKHLSSNEFQRWAELMQDLEKEDISVANVQRTVARHVKTTLARTHHSMDEFAAYQATAHTVRDQLIENWDITQCHHTAQQSKRVYYLSLEFLIGRSLDNALLNLEVKGTFKEAMRQLGFELETLVEQELDAALGNGGLGRLAACFMDSLATGDYPAWGYGLRYNYGIFQQQIRDGYQVEYPDFWLNYGNIWEMPRFDVVYEVNFYGSVSKTTNPDGKVIAVWEGGESVEAIAYDVPIPGFRTKNCINIRLWRSVPKKKFDFASFNEGNYQKSVEENMKAENITSVLYPNDNTMAGKELRLKQQFFFVCATLKDILRRFKKTKAPWSELPNHVAIQLNDTHPTLGIVELQRQLMDLEWLDWDVAWNLVTKVFSFTNHTILPEALEKWSVPMMQHLLPRHLEIIFDINLFFLQKVEKKYPNDRDRLVRMSIIEEASPQYVRMAYLGIVGSHTVNGVAAIHSSLLKTTLFKDFVEFYGDSKFQNKTNGITPRRWLHQANRSLSNLITEKLGSDDFLLDLDKLKELRKYVDDADFQKKWMDIKYENKVRLAKYIKLELKVDVDPKSLFDIQVKRIHEYKRQFMNILYVIHRYEWIRKLSPQDHVNVVPRTIVFAGKAAPGYYVAKLIIKLINEVAKVVNEDESIGNLLKVIFLPDYDVSLAEIITPASDISQHISTASTEASGTSNMKFVLNGGLILGTLDGANIEIKEEIGDENIFVFGHLAHEIEDLRHNQRYRRPPMDPQMAAVISVIQQGRFGAAKIYQPLIDTLTVGCDNYLLSADFGMYLDAQTKVDEAFKDKKSWAKKSIMCTAGMGKFSSDRCIREYAEQIWKLDPCRVPEGTIDRSESQNIQF